MAISSDPRGGIAGESIGGSLGGRDQGWAGGNVDTGSSGSYSNTPDRGGNGGNGGDRSTSSKSQAQTAYDKQVAAIKNDPAVRQKLAQILAAAKAINPNSHVQLSGLHEDGTIDISIDGLNADQAKAAGIGGFLMGINANGYTGSFGSIQTGHRIEGAATSTTGFGSGSGGNGGNTTAPKELTQITQDAESAYNKAQQEKAFNEASARTLTNYRAQLDSWAGTGGNAPAIPGNLNAADKAAAHAYAVDKTNEAISNYTGGRTSTKPTVPSGLSGDERAGIDFRMKDLDASRASESALLSWNDQLNNYSYNASAGRPTPPAAKSPQQAAWQQEQLATADKEHQAAVNAANGNYSPAMKQYLQQLNDYAAKGDISKSPPEWPDNLPYAEIDVAVKASADANQRNFAVYNQRQQQALQEAQAKQQAEFDRQQQAAADQRAQQALQQQQAQASAAEAERQQAQASATDLQGYLKQLDTYAAAGDVSKSPPNIPSTIKGDDWSKAFFAQHDAISKAGQNQLQRQQQQQQAAKVVQTNQVAAPALTPEQQEAQRIQQQSSNPVVAPSSQPTQAELERQARAASSNALNDYREQLALYQNNPSMRPPYTPSNLTADDAAAAQTALNRANIQRASTASLDQYFNDLRNWANGATDTKPSMPANMTSDDASRAADYSSRYEQTRGAYEQGQGVQRTQANQDRTSSQTAALAQAQADASAYQQKSADSLQKYHDDLQKWSEGSSDTAPTPPADLLPSDQKQADYYQSTYNGIRQGYDQRAAERMQSASQLNQYQRDLQKWAAGGATSQPSMPSGMTAADQQQAQVYQNTYTQGRQAHDQAVGYGRTQGNIARTEQQNQALQEAQQRQAQQPSTLSQILNAINPIGTAAAAEVTPNIQQGTTPTTTAQPTRQSLTGNEKGFLDSTAIAAGWRLGPEENGVQTFERTGKDGKVERTTLTNTTAGTSGGKPTNVWNPYVDDTQKPNDNTKAQSGQAKAPDTNQAGTKQNVSTPKPQTTPTKQQPPKQTTTVLNPPPNPVISAATGPQVPASPPPTILNPTPAPVTQPVTPPPVIIPPNGGGNGQNGGSGNTGGTSNPQSPATQGGVGQSINTQPTQTTQPIIIPPNGNGGQQGNGGGTGQGNGQGSGSGTGNPSQSAGQGSGSPTTTGTGTGNQGTGQNSGTGTQQSIGGSLGAQVNNAQTQTVTSLVDTTTKTPGVAPGTIVGQPQTLAPTSTPSTTQIVNAPTPKGAGTIVQGMPAGTPVGPQQALAPISTPSNSLVVNAPTLKGAGTLTQGTPAGTAAGPQQPIAPPKQTGLSPATPQGGSAPSATPGAPVTPSAPPTPTPTTGGTGTSAAAQLTPAAPGTPAAPAAPSATGAMGTATPTTGASGGALIQTVNTPSPAGVGTPQQGTAAGTAVGEQRKLESSSITYSKAIENSISQTTKDLGSWAQVGGKIALGFTTGGPAGAIKEGINEVVSNYVGGSVGTVIEKAWDDMTGRKDFEEDINNKGNVAGGGKGALSTGADVVSSFLLGTAASGGNPVIGGIYALGRYAYDQGWFASLLGSGGSGSGTIYPNGNGGSGTGTGTGNGTGSGTGTGSGNGSGTGNGNGNGNGTNGSGNNTGGSNTPGTGTNGTGSGNPYDPASSTWPADLYKNIFPQYYPKGNGNPTNYTNDTSKPTVVGSLLPTPEQLANVPPSGTLLTSLAARRQRRTPLALQTGAQGNEALLQRWAGAQGAVGGTSGNLLIYSGGNI